MVCGRWCLGCEYGNRADWCTMLRPSYCYTDSYQCCQSCAHFFNQSAGLTRFTLCRQISFLDQTTASHLPTANRTNLPTFLLHSFHKRSLRGALPPPPKRRSTCIVKCMLNVLLFFSCAVLSRGIANLYSPVIRYSIVILYQ